MFVSLTLFLTLFDWVLLESTSFRSKRISTNLNAKWPQTSLVAETAEFLSSIDSDYFWRFIRLSCDHKQKFEGGNTRTTYNNVLALVEQNFDMAGRMGLLRLALSLRVHSPLIELHRQLAAHHLQQAAVSNCSSFAVVVQNQHQMAFVCDSDHVTGVDWSTTSDGAGLDLLPTDHVFHVDAAHSSTTTASSFSSHHTVLLYGHLGTSHFCRMFARYSQHSASSSHTLVIRHHSQNMEDRSQVRLSGYSVELAIKSTEYKAQDDSAIDDIEATIGEEDVEDINEVEGFVFSKLKQRFPNKSTELDKFRRHLLLQSSDAIALKVWQLQDLSMQAIVRVMNHTDYSRISEWYPGWSKERQEAMEKLKALTNLAQNFPVLARSLIRMKVGKQLKASVRTNRLRIQKKLGVSSDDAALYINGRSFEVSDKLDVFALLHFLKQEANVLQALHHSGIRQANYIDFLSLNVGSRRPDFAVDFRDTAITWFTDVSSSSQFRRFSSSLSDLMQPTFPGMMNIIRRNMYYVVLLLDPGDIHNSLPILNTVYNLYTDHLPITIGVVWTNVTHSPDVAGVQDSRVAFVEALNYARIARKYSGLKLLKFAIKILTEAQQGTSEGQTAGTSRLTYEHVLGSTRSVIESGTTIDDVFGGGSEYDAGRVLAFDFCQRLSLCEQAQVLFNGRKVEDEYVNALSLETHLLQLVMRAMRDYTRSLQSGDLTDEYEENMSEWLAERDTVVPRLNPQILASNQTTLKFETLPPGLAPSSEDHHTDDGLFTHMGVSLPSPATLSSSQMSQYVLHMLNYVSVTHCDLLCQLTYWFVADLRAERSRSLFAHIIRHARTTNSLRVSFVPATDCTSSPSTLPDINYHVLLALDTLSGDTLVTFLLNILRNASLTDALTTLDSENTIRFTDALKSTKGFDRCRFLHKYSSQTLMLSETTATLIANGIILQPFSQQYVDEDLVVLEKFLNIGSAQLIGNKIKSVFDSKRHGVRHLSDVLLKLTAVLFDTRSETERVIMPSLDLSNSVIVAPPGDSSQPVFQLFAVCDPLSHAAQLLTQLVTTLYTVVNARITFVLNPVEKHSDMPLTRFFRLALDPEMRFSRAGSRIQGATTVFSGVPGSLIFTQNYFVPDNWMVESVVSPYDLDNIKLNDIDGNVHSDFELEYLLVEGDCYDYTTGAPPRGLQLALAAAGTSGTVSHAQQTPRAVDTIVMSNLGYFQLKSTPGVWSLGLRSGRSARLYEIVTYNNRRVATKHSSSHVQVVVSSFTSHTVHLRVVKRREYKDVDLLSDTEKSPGGLWDSLKYTLGVGSDDPNSFPDQAEIEEGDVINVFSLASGHLYERLMRIMMLSVLRHTHTPVKFWFLKNYLSPTFVDLLPHMAAEYRFEYELVQYKWPKWLNQQREKQRTIWGYKILFLDVLFPLHVKKIIFVDADQIVRADLRELRDLDLEGAPYAYTPFCDSRTEMDGFRFWKSGYWRSHLMGRSYHISALYVVDLKKFRQMAAGDRLRGQYQSLSEDANSLSNLDQDLPNNMIHQVRIKSLPQEWLWCETWCDDASKRRAKTIDLCNNPMTKEPKLTAAVRIVAEWVEYDNIIRNLTDRVRDLRHSRQGALHLQTQSDGHHTNIEL